MASSRLACALLSAAFGIMLGVACAVPVSGDVVIGTRDLPPALGSSDASSSEGALCPATGEGDVTCPPGLTTCDPSNVCAVDLSSDLLNCGACANHCDQGVSRNTWHALLNVEGHVCEGGRCSPLCREDMLGIFRDCNHRPDDGCESNTIADHFNCGACGKACPDGTRCIYGECGCPHGLTYCESPTDNLGDNTPWSYVDVNGNFDGQRHYFKCVDLAGDSKNCGTCGNACSPPAEPCSPLPPHTGYGCANATCGKLDCAPSGGREYRDCDGDLTKGCASDGCETNITDDPDNCGACGVKADLMNDPKNCGACHHECQRGMLCNNGECACPPGQEACTDPVDPTITQCVDFLNDVNHCGACWNQCPSLEIYQIYGNPFVNNGHPVCSKGVCEYVCNDGKGDCDGDQENGCETDLGTDSLHCGSCDVSCNTAIGQPCVKGTCLMTECAPGVTR